MYKNYGVTYFQKLKQSISIIHTKNYTNKLEERSISKNIQRIRNIRIQMISKSLLINN